MPTGIYDRTKAKSRPSCPEETKKKISNANLGRHHTLEERIKISKGLKGKPSPKKGIPISEEQKKKISEANKGHIAWNKGKSWSEEIKKKISRNSSRHFLGKHHTKEAKEKIRQANLGSKNSLGFKHTEEWKRKHIERMRGNKYGLGNHVLLGFKHSMETRIKKSMRRGNQIYNYKGTTPLYEQIRKNFKYRQWRDDVFMRDNFTCQECGLHSGCGKAIYLHAHHIIFFSDIVERYEILTFKEAMNCEELWNMNNGQTLCKDCHKQLHSELSLTTLRIKSCQKIFQSS